MALVILNHIRVDEVEGRFVKETQDEITKGKDTELKQLEEFNRLHY
jgi:hypothetical protein